MSISRRWFAGRSSSFGVLLALVAAVLQAAGSVEERSLAGDGWKFARDPGGRLLAAAEDFDDSKWQDVRVPHDWAISGPFLADAENGNTSKLPWKGVGWYRRTFTLEPKDAGSSVFLDFDGVMASPEVYVNGVKVGSWSYGYASVRVDATAAVRFGGVNVLAVRADTRDHRSRWYPGAGLYRKVTLRLRNSVRFAWNGIFITTPEVSAERAEVRLAWEAEGPVPDGAKVRVSLAPAVDGARRPGAEIAAGDVGAGRKTLSLTVAKPALWDVDSPNLHFATVELVDADGKALDRERIRFGIRRIAFPVPTEGPDVTNRAANGFHLNGRRVQLKGANLHSDLGLLGMAFDRSAARRQLEIMKDMGVNALRTSHNPPAPEVLDLCDEMGIVVWDEAFDKWGGAAGRRDEKVEDYISGILRDFVRRDRNHPSVIIWSMSNEIREDGFEGITDGLTRARCALFREVMRLEDATRPVGNGNIGSMSAENILAQGIFDDLDVTGWNYKASYRNPKKRNPHQVIVYSESASAYSSYGYYPERLPQHIRDFDGNVKQVDGYDFNAGPSIADVEFDRMETDAYCCGEFVWTGIDYLGEPTPFGKGKDAARSSYFGAVDLTGVPKDRFWLYRSLWNGKDDTVHIVPHWTWPGREGRKVPVFVYTNGDRAELFVNGKSMGVRRKGELVKGETCPTNAYYEVCARYRLMWFDVPYEPGEIRAVAYRGECRIGEETVRTAGKPVKLAATPERRYTDDPDELLWVQIDALDAKGVRNPTAADRVGFRLEGPGEILGVGNGNANEFEPFAETDSRRLFNGKAMAVVRRTGAGPIRLTVSADGLESAETVLDGSCVPEVRWIDGRDIPVEGLAFGGEPRELPYDRLPLSAKGRVTKGVWNKARNSSGVTFRFASDTKRMRIRWTAVVPNAFMHHQASSGTSGIDVYRRVGDGEWQYVRTGFPKADPKTGEYGGEIALYGLAESEYAINAPLYNGLKSLSVGIDAKAGIRAARPHRNGGGRPVVFYGTSSTQGAVASRPGLSFTSLIGRKLDVSVVNLGFSGAGKMEMEMVDYVAGIDACCYVIDTPGNMTPGLVEDRYEKFVRELHRRRPDVPMVFAENRHYLATPNPHPGFARILRPLAERLRGEGWKIAYIRSEDMFRTDVGDTSVEGSHPNDFGMKQLAESYGAAIAEALSIR